VGFGVINVDKGGHGELRFKAGKALLMGEY
jgi:hypothetical protein